MDDVLAKAHVHGYSKKDGTYVKPHERGDVGAPLPPHTHPQPGEKGQAITVHAPHHASAPSTWHNPDAVATFLPGGDVPLEINGLALHPWKDHPRTTGGWEFVDGINEHLDEPPLRLPPGKKAAAGVVIEEADGRVWLCAPTNGFGGYHATFPKGTAEDELSLQANAIKEAWEEAGLQIEITGFIGDFERTTSMARMYRARRVGGTPVSMGWESQAMHLVPKSHLFDLLNGPADHPIAELIGAGPAPIQTQAPEPAKQKSLFGMK